MAVKKTSGTSPSPSRHELIILLGCLLVVFVTLFYKSFLPEKVLFNNDTPLGAYVQNAVKFPEACISIWMDLNWLGLEGPAAQPDLDVGFQWLVGPVWYAKFWTPITLMILGLSAGVFFRSIKLSPAACVLGGLGAALHSDFFSGACWGQVSSPMALSTMFLALALLQNISGGRGWVKIILAGLTVGLGVVEGFDKAALLSLVVAAYVIFQELVMGEEAIFKKFLWGGLRVALIAGFAAFFAIQAMTGLIGTQIKGVAGMAQDAESKAQHWDVATQWSLPKVETLAFIVPGLFGYRMDSPGGGNYWGKVGRDPAWDRYFASGKQGPTPQGYLRFSGGCSYAGSLMVAVAFWTLLQSFRKKNSPLNSSQKKFIWFWAGIGIFCLMLAYGRFAPFFQLFYALPYASTIRNPVKFCMLFDWSVLIIFAYGIHGITQRIRATQSAPNNRGVITQWQAWWSTASSFDKKWIFGSIAALGVSVLGGLIYSSADKNLQNYLQEVGFDAGNAENIAHFSIHQVGWFILFLTLALGSIALVLSGYFSGHRAKFGLLLLGAALVVDLGCADLPLIKYWDWPQKYASNPILDRLRDKSWEQRVVGLPGWILDAFQVSEQAKGTEQYLDQLYRIEWAQHHFLYYNIQSLDVIQMPRPPVDFVAYESALQVHSGNTLHLLTRKWELTNTRYIFGMAGIVDLLNKQFDPGQERFRVAESFNIVPKSGVLQVTKLEELTAEKNTNGVYALIEFTGALPRAKLYADWQVSTNDETTLRQLASTAFDPAQTVLVADAAIAAPTAMATTNQIPRTVEITSYAPRYITLKAQATTATVLLLNDRYSDGWRVLVDSKPDKLLRCNYLMRGVRLTPGAHTVEFVFERPTKLLKISLAAIGLTLALLGGLFLVRPKTRGQAP